MHPFLKCVASVATVLSLGACTAGVGSFNRATVAHDLQQRTGFQLPVESPVSSVVLPEGIRLEQALDVNALALIALWNNANFKALLVDMQLAQADLEQAGLLPNPELMYSFQVANKPFKYALDLPIEALWLRPMRLKVAEADAKRVNNVIQQAGLDLIRDVRQASIDLIALRDQQAIQRQSQSLRGEIASLTDKRLEHGDISEPEALLARVEASRASQNEKRASYEVAFAEQKLLLLLGLQTHTQPLKIKADAYPACETALLDIDKVIAATLDNRPDLLAAASTIETNQAKETLSRFSWLRLLGIGDATSGDSGHVLSPAVRVTVPLFNRNQGNINRATAEVEKAERQRQALLQQAQTELRQQFTRYQQSCTELNILTQQLKPLADQALQSAQVSYDKGDISYLTMLESSKQLIDANIQEAILNGAIYKAWAEMDRGSGNQLSKHIQADQLTGFAASNLTTDK
ncbi:MAG: TolC family protein [Methylophilus sp.]|uniref:TolC family protein n=1 Tax=Methylophilus sp. TaxID=29541 RepID=UPI003F9FC72A